MKKLQHMILFLSLLGLLLLLPAETVNAAGNTRIHFISLGGSSDAILLESNGHFGMVDSGEDTDYPDGSDPRYPFRTGIVTTEGYEGAVINYLKKVGVKKLDFYIGTHAHSDHVGSGDEILETFPTKKLYFRKYSDKNISSIYALWDNQYCYDNLIRAAKKQNTQIIQNFNQTENRIFTLGDMQIEIMNYKIRKTPKGNIVRQKDDNNNSLGVKITAYGQTAFLGGDINNSAPEHDESKMAGLLKHVDLLKLNHHGYTGSNTNSYLKRLTPSYAVVTGSASNLTAGTLNTLNTLGTQLYSTHNQPSNSAVIADFNEKQRVIRMIPPGNLSLKKKTSSGTTRVAFYTSSNKRYTRKTGWFYYNQRYYYLTDDGYVKRNSWIREGNDWYYLDNNGEMVTDSLRIKGVPYSFYVNGKLSKGGWTQGTLSRSFAKPNGKAYSGLFERKGKTYFFDRNGRMQTGFVFYRQKTYYFRPNGAMLKNAALTVDQYRYTFNKKGICTKKVRLDSPDEPSSPSWEDPTDPNAPALQ